MKLAAKLLVLSLFVVGLTFVGCKKDDKGGDKGGKEKAAAKSPADGTTQVSFSVDGMV